MKVKTLTTTAATVALTFGMGAALAGELNDENTYVLSDVPAIFGDVNLNEAMSLNEAQMEAVQGQALPLAAIIAGDILVLGTIALIHKRQHGLWPFD